MILLTNDNLRFEKSEINGRTELPLTVATTDLDGDGTPEVYTASHNALDEKMGDQHRLALYKPVTSGEC